MTAQSTIGSIWKSKQTGKLYKLGKSTWPGLVELRCSDGSWSNMKIASLLKNYTKVRITKTLTKKPKSKNKR